MIFLLLYLNYAIVYFILFLLVILNVNYYLNSYSQGDIVIERKIPGSLFVDDFSIPVLSDSNLMVEKVFEGLELPTSMEFLGDNDILVLEKSKGTVNRITNGTLHSEPLLHLPVTHEVERGMLGLDSVKTNNATFVFVYLTENLSSNKTTEGTENSNVHIANRLYKYELVDNKLINPKLLLDLPATPGPRHNGGTVTIGPDNNVYLVIGDVDGHTTQAQNMIDGGTPDGTSGILVITQDGLPTGKNILGNFTPLNKYYAYGIRNGFGLDFDPITGHLWDTENGAGSDDEINMIEPGFNSGWLQVQGKAPYDFDRSLIYDFDKKGKYSDPKFSWIDTVGPTAIKFLNTQKLGKQYYNDIIIGDVHKGRLYHFELNSNRSDFLLDGVLKDKIANTDAENKELILGQDFGAITDLEIGSDGYLYVLSLGHGTIYKISPKSIINIS